MYEHYQVSNLGRIKNQHGLIMSEKQQGQSGCYLGVHLSKSNVKKKKLTHILVAEAFCHNPDPERKTTVNHIRTEPNHNFATNLEWASWEDQTEWKRQRAGITIDANGYARDRAGNYV